MKKRHYPKCFKAHFDAVLFFDFIHENYPHVKEELCFVELCKTYTSLLCGLHMLQLKGDTVLLRRRFQRFLTLHYYQECEWRLLIQNYQNRLHKYSQELFILIDSGDLPVLQKFLHSLDNNIFSSLDSLEKEEKMKLV